MKKIGVGKGESGESENWKCSHLTAQDAVSLQRKAELIDQLNYGGTCKEAGLVLEAHRKGSIIAETNPSLCAKKSSILTC